MITCTLKSALPDLILPLSSFSSRMHAAPAASTMTLFVSNGVKYASDISLRLSGSVELAFNGIVFGVSDSITSMLLFEGASKTTVQMNTTGLYPVVAPANIDLEGVSFKTLNINGDVRLRSKFNPDIEPGSIVSFDGESHTVDQITVSQSVDNYTMELFANA